MIVLINHNLSQKAIFRSLQL